MYALFPCQERALSRGDSSKPPFALDRWHNTVRMSSSHQKTAAEAEECSYQDLCDYVSEKLMATKTTLNMGDSVTIDWEGSRAWDGRRMAASTRAHSGEGDSQTQGETEQNDSSISRKKCSETVRNCSTLNAWSDDGLSEHCEGDLSPHSMAESRALQGNSDDGHEDDVGVGDTDVDVPASCQGAAGIERQSGEAENSSEPGEDNKEITALDRLKHATDAVVDKTTATFNSASRKTKRMFGVEPLPDLRKTSHL